MREPNMNTWNYLSIDETSEIAEDWVWERLRKRRDGLLSICDVKMVTDAPWDLAPWKAYRQALRDLPANTKDPRKAVWPVSPDGLSVPLYVEPYIYIEPIIEEQLVIEEEINEAETL